MPTDELWNNVSIRVRSRLFDCREFCGIIYLFQSNYWIVSKSFNIVSPTMARSRLLKAQVDINFQFFAFRIDPSQ
jgi:hypothetical protein